MMSATLEQDLKNVKHSGRYKVEDLLEIVALLAADKSLPKHC